MWVYLANWVQTRCPGQLLPQEMLVLDSRFQRAAQVLDLLWCVCGAINIRTKSHLGLWSQFVVNRIRTNEATVVISKHQKVLQCIKRVFFVVSMSKDVTALVISIRIEMKSRSRDHKEVKL